MAAPIGALHAAMSAGHAQFAADMGKAKRSVQSNATGMQKAMERAKTGFNGTIKAIKLMSVAGLAAAAVLGKMVSNAITNADEMTKMSQAVGLNVESLIALTHAADLSGVSASVLQKSLKKVAQGAAEAADGTGLAKDAYKALGISVTDATGLLKNSDQIMLEVADKFAMMEDGAGKTALSMEIFGKSGTDMISMLNQGSDGIREMMEEAVSLGMVLDLETGQSAERFRDNLTRLKGVKVGLVNTIVTAVLPTLESYTNSMVDSAKETDSMAKAGEAAATALKLLLTAGTLVKVAFDAVGSTIGGMGAVIWEFVNGRWKNAWDLAGDVVGDFKGDMQGAADSIGDIWDTAAANVEASAPEVGKKLVAPLAVAVTETELEAAKLKKTVDRYEAELTASAQRVFEGTRTPVEQFAIRIVELDELLENGAISLDTYTRAVADANEKLAGMADDSSFPEYIDELSAAEERAYREYDQRLNETGKSFDSLGDTIDDWGQKSEGAILDFALSGKANFKDMIDSMISDLVRLIAKQLILKALGGGIFGGIFGDGDAFSGGKVIPFASGGVVSSPMLFPMARGMGLMGESGPEAIMPLKRTAGGELGVQVADGDKTKTPRSVIINVPGGTRIMTAEERGMAAINAIDDYLRETGDRLPSGRVINFQT